MQLKTISPASLDFYLKATGAIAGFFFLLLGFYFLKILPFGLMEVIFLGILSFMFALYRPRIMFWVFMGALPLETFILTPSEMPVSLRPYQLLGAALAAATVIHWLRKKNPLQLGFTFKRHQGNTEDSAAPSKNLFSRTTDVAVVLMIGLAFAAAFFGPDIVASIKQALVLFSFGILYAIGRYYLRYPVLRGEAAWFFLIGTKISLLVGLYQAVAYRLGWPDWEVMPGRVNGTFTEPDWYGMFLVVLLAVILSVKYYFRTNKTGIMVAGKPIRTVVGWGLSVASVLIVLQLILTVARSAWVGAFFVMAAYFCLLGYEWFKAKNSKDKIQVFKGQRQQFSPVDYQMKSILREVGFFTATLIISFAIVEFGRLSSFHIFNRAVSSVSGLQQITISCQLPQAMSVPAQITAVEELAAYGCRHINLEEIASEKMAGREVREILRPDPNVGIRKKIYATVWEKIKQQPLIGYGLGSAPVFLGQDERGAGLNSSNIFLEAWLSLGIGGFLALLWIIFMPVAVVCREILVSKQRLSVRQMFLLLGTLAVVIPNMFNAGLLMGFFWIWAAGAVSIKDQGIAKQV